MLAIGIDVGATKTAAGIVEVETGTIDTARAIATDLARGGDVLLRDCARLAQQLAAGAEIAAIGIGVCETVDTNGRVTSAHSFDWRNDDVAHAFSDIAPTCVESDVRAAALGEAVYGAGRDLQSFLYVNAGSGISSSLVIEGAPYRGARGNAILIGAGPLNAEAVASGTALHKLHGTSPADLERAAAAGDSSAARTLARAGAALGEAIGFAVNLLDPEAVVLGGGVALGSRAFAEAAERAMRAQIWAANARALPLFEATLGADVGVVGAALAGVRALPGS